MRQETAPEHERDIEGSFFIVSGYRLVQLGPLLTDCTQSVFTEA